MTLTLHVKDAVARSEAMVAQEAMSYRGRGAVGMIVDFSPQAGYSGLQGQREQGANRARYAQFRGWLYSAINALASEAASQPVVVGRLGGKAKPKKKKGPRDQKAFHLLKMSRRLRQKAAGQELEIIQDHPLLDILAQPNPIQRQWQFVYSFVCNLCLTGWSFVVADKIKVKGSKEQQNIFYSLPTTWVTPDHSKGPFAEFKVQNPYNPTIGEGDPIPASNVGFAYLPNPAHPLAATPPSGAQTEAIRVDEYIQQCQAQFFENGVFPSVIVTIGKDPHPEVAGGVRPRLTGAQRRQVHMAIKRSMGGVANYGNPAIVDGLIESIERLSSTQQEIGWEKSEETVRTRILSAFGVHPFILGEPMNVGGYAQAAIIDERFCKKVNIYLDLLGGVMTGFVAEKSKKEEEQIPDSEKLLVWWEEAKPHDPNLYWQNMRFASQQDIVGKNEFRAALNLPPDENESEMFISPRAAVAVAQVIPLLATGQCTPDQARAFFEGLGIPEDISDAIAGKGPTMMATQQQATQQLATVARLLRIENKRTDRYQKLLEEELDVN